MALETMQVEERKKSGTGASRKLRHEAKIPAVLYGQGKDSQHLTLPAKQFVEAVSRHVRVFQLGWGKEKAQALVKDIQYDHVGEEILHVDFYRVKEGQKVRVKVAIDFQGHPKGVTAGGEFVHVISDLEVDCEVMHIPESIPIKVSDLEINQSVTVADLNLPHGVSTPVPKESIVCTVAMKALEPEPTAAGVAPTATEPELIAKRPATEEGAEAGEAAAGAAKPGAAAKEEKPKKEEKK